MGKYLRSDNGTIGFDLKWSLLEVTRRTGLKPRAQLWEIIRLVLGPGKMDVQSYYALGLWRREMDWTRKVQFVSGRWGEHLHRKLQPEALRIHNALFNDKVLFAAILGNNGFAVPDILATTGEPRFPAKRHFNSAPALADFLRSVDLPIFGKPTHSSRNLGSFSLLARDGAFGTMGDGSTVDLEDLAAEIITDHPAGYVIQRFITPHPLLAAFSSTALPTIRVLTLRGPDGFKPLYATLRVPGLATNVDDMGSKDCAFAVIDPATGAVTKARDSDQMRGRFVTVHPASGQPLVGITLPHWDKVVDVTESAHAMFPEHANIGWDVAIGPDGPILVEGNASPRHDALYQYPADEPFLNDAFKAKLDWAIADAQHRVARLKKR